MRRLLIAASAFCFMLFAANSAMAQAKKATPKKKETITAKAMTEKNEAVDALKRPENDKANPTPKPASTRGDVYGANYSDIIVSNLTGYTIDVYVDGNYRGTIAPYDRRVTWAVPGNTVLYAKAPFSDGSYYYWGPTTVKTGYQYTWTLNP